MSTTTTKTYYVGLTGGRIFCFNCSPYLLYCSINIGRKNQKNFKGYDDETFSIMTEDEVAYMQNVLKSSQICECN